MKAIQPQRIIITDLVRDALPYAALVNVTLDVGVIVTYEVNQRVHTHKHDCIRDAMDYWRAEYLLRTCPSVLAMLFEDDDTTGDDQIGRIDGDGLSDWRDEEYD